MITDLFTSIITPRLVLREFRETDLDAMHAVMGNAQVMRFSLNGPYSRQKTREFLEGCLQGYRKRGVGLFAVVHRVEEKVIGYCGLHFPAIDGTEEVEIGYRLHPDYWNQGLATEAAIAVREFGFQKCGFTRLISCIEGENTASIRVAEKSGMKHEKNSHFAGKVPVRIYAIRRDLPAEQDAVVAPRMGCGQRSVSCV